MSAVRAVDAIVIGSGHNGLVAAAYLARAGWDVEVLERNPSPGGAVATEELTLPGFRHDPLSSWHPLFHLSAAFAELGEELAVRGLRYRNTDVPAATVRRDGSAVVAFRDPERTAKALPGHDGTAYLAALERFGSTADTVGELMATELFSLRAAWLAVRLARRLGRAGTLEFTRDTVASARAWLQRTFTHRDVDALLAPWALHTGLAPDQAGGGFMLLAIAGALHQVGMPVVEGGSAGFVDAFVRLIADHGGRVRTGTEVERILIERGRAVGVRVRVDGEEIRARRAVIANVAPTQLYGRLLPAEALPEELARRSRGYRYGRGDMQIHLALSEPPRWRDPALAEAAVIHLSEGSDTVAVACAQASAGLLPARPTVVCGQPTALDPTRAPGGKAILWIQLQETPYAPAGDAAGQLTADGTWTESLKEAYADRVLALIAAHTDNLEAATLARAVLSPADLERRNVNLVRGDPYAGSCELDQAFLLRPLPGAGSHRTPVHALWQCGASTYPGPGLNAASGRIVAKALLSRRIRRSR